LARCVSGFFAAPLDDAVRTVDALADIFPSPAAGSAAVAGVVRDLAGGTDSLSDATARSAGAAEASTDWSGPGGPRRLAAPAGDERRRYLLCRPTTSTRPGYLDATCLLSIVSRPGVPGRFGVLADDPLTEEVAGELSQRDMVVLLGVTLRLRDPNLHPVLTCAPLAGATLPSGHLDHRPNVVMSRRAWVGRPAGLVREEAH
jgi:hypothetical protein